MSRVIGFILIIIATSYVSAKEITTPEELFKQYLELGDNFDPQVANLYSDNAKIMAFRKYPHGLERQMELTGLQWKSLLSKIMPGAKVANDISTYKNVEIQKIANGFKIKADRYSERKCYMDIGYYMIIKPSDSGALFIVEEYSETQPQSNC